MNTQDCDHVNTVHIWEASGATRIEANTQCTELYYLICLKCDSVIDTERRMVPFSRCVDREPYEPTR